VSAPQIQLGPDPNLWPEALQKYYHEKLRATQPQVWIPHQPTTRQELFLELDCLEAFYGGAAGGGKALSVGTLIPTLSGWKRNGDLVYGDIVFDERGKSCRVVKAFDVTVPDQCFRLTFDDGSQMEASAEHKWLTFSATELAALTRRDPEWRAKRRARRESRAAGIKSAVFTASLMARNKANPPPSLPLPTGTVCTTVELYESLYVRNGSRANHAVPLAGTLELPDIDLPLDPYMLGAWLGDGTASAGSITTADIEIVEAFQQFNIHKTSGKYQYGTFGLRPILRQMGVFRNKHVPPVYLRSSRRQRMALVQGLMDTDGTANESGSVGFTNTNKRIVDALWELIVSLGWKARIVESRAKLNGRDCGPMWSITWTPSEYVFRLARKRDRQKLATRRTTKFRYIVDCAPIPSVAMRCIAVDSPSHLYLAGRSMVPTHNSDALLMAALKYANIPGYAAILFRRTYTDLTLPEALMTRAQEWLSNTPARWVDKEKTWKFPSGATLTFGYLESENDKFRYQSSAFQFIGFDEASQFTEGQYTYLFSRLRRLANSQIPLRVRAASNPGGVGAIWVYDRFIPENFSPEQAREITVWEKAGTNDEGTPVSRVFIPSTLNDNPYLDRAGYERSLANLDPVTRAQLLRGDWMIKERGNILPMWDEYAHVIKRSEFRGIFGQDSIPDTWLCSVYQDWGSTAEHPCVTTWFATVPQNGPVVNGVMMAGQVFAYRSLMTWDATVREVATIIEAVMSGSEKSRTQRWLMSHEAASERAAYRREHDLPFQAWVTGKTRGIAQLRNALELVEIDKPHPFRPEIKGHPKLYFLVDDNEFVYPKTDKGFARHRAEFPAYKWATLKSGDPLTNLIPYALFNDAIDTVRSAAADYWPASLELTYQEKVIAQIPEKYNPRLLQERYTPELEMSISFQQAQAKSKVAKSNIVTFDEFGEPVKDDQEDY